VVVVVVVCGLWAAAVMRGGPVRQTAVWSLWSGVVVVLVIGQKYPTSPLIRQVQPQPLLDGLR
jgi:hypothetical protein